MKTKNRSNETENFDNEIENSVGEIRTSEDKEEVQLERLSASIRKILDGRKARRHLSPDGVGRDDGTPEKPGSDEPPVEWAMRLMF